jgi:hypothetical protein
LAFQGYKTSLEFDDKTGEGQFMDKASGNMEISGVT